MQQARARSRPHRAAGASGAPDGNSRAASAGAGTTPGTTQSVRYLDVDEDDAGRRLDNFVARHFAQLPKSHVYRWIRSGQLRVNGARRSIDYRLRGGDRIRIPPVFVGGGQDGAPSPTGRARPGAVAADASSDAMQHERVRLAHRLTVLFEDDDLIAIDKPASVAVHGGSAVSSGVIEQLRAARPQARFLELVHRLDRDTSGVLLLAKRRVALVSLHAQLRERRVDKRYRAIVVGRWPLRTRTLAWPLLRHEAPDGNRRVSVDERAGLESITRVTGLARSEVPGLGVFSLVEAQLETGRTHQIRVHLAHAGLPIAGDGKYGDFALNRQLARAGYKRMYLHARSIAFRHPRTDAPLCIEAPMPQTFDELLAGGDRDGVAARGDGESR